VKRDREVERGLLWGRGKGKGRERDRSPFYSVKKKKKKENETEGTLFHTSCKKPT
jgi:hypothetical protein